MKRVAKLDKFTAHRSKKPGDIGEDLAEILLNKNGFKNVRNLNHHRKNFPFADFYAEKESVNYIISVKIRNKYQRSGSLNDRYKLGKKCYENSEPAEKEFNAVAAWLTTSFDSKTYSAYFGLLSLLNGSRGVRMTEKAIAFYECLAKEEPHSYNYGELKNVYEVKD
ncbi:MAG: hypothetical protein M3388_01655 [Acidobacteriota bacterium]|nr:hypothetical protein [Acidobacteriota bacterium]